MVINGIKTFLDLKNKGWLEKNISKRGKTFRNKYEKLVQ